MTDTTISYVLSEYEAFSELMEDAYWEASSIGDKDFIYDILSIFTKEINELNKLSIQDHHYRYETVTEGIRRILPKINMLDERKAMIIKRTTTLVDLSEVLSNIRVILESEHDDLATV